MEAPELMELGWRGKVIGLVAVEIIMHGSGRDVNPLPSRTSKTSAGAAEC